MPEVQKIRCAWCDREIKRSRQPGASSPDGFRGYGMRVDGFVLRHWPIDTKMRPLFCRLNCVTMFAFAAWRGGFRRKFPNEDVSGSG